MVDEEEHFITLCVYPLAGLHTCWTVHHRFYTGLLHNTIDQFLLGGYIQVDTYIGNQPFFIRMGCNGCLPVKPAIGLTIAGQDIRSGLVSDFEPLRPTM